MGGRGRTRGRRAMAPTANMASTPVTLDINPSPTSRQIPLLCSVCPETPKFSDVSHLLTHIASKGHLHHETQTKLRAHQDITAALALQQYEQWYRDFEIETLLVERLRAKQVKEAARGRRLPPSSLIGGGRDKPKPKGPTFEDFIKVEEEYYPDFPILPSLLSADFDSGVVVEHVTGPDMMALKGQVWPGMGKMDLANDEMKRTRNQRKPKSVIERMRRASQGIEPTEVVMSTELEVERIRGVYDKTSSPEPDDTEPASEKKPKQKRKRPAPLSEISANIPRGFGRPTTTETARLDQRGRQPRAKDLNDSLHTTSSFQPYRREHNQLGDEADTFLSAGWQDEPPIRSAHTLGSFPYATYATAPQGDHTFNHRERHATHSLNPFSLSNRESPTSMTKQGGSRLHGLLGHGRMSTRAQQMATHDFSTSSFSNPSTPSSPPGARFQDSSRLSMLSNHHLHGQTQSSYQNQPEEQHRLKQEDFTLTESPFRNSAYHPFMGLAGHNPLFASERGFAELGTRSIQNGAASPLGFLPINRDGARTQGESYEQGPTSSEGTCVKIEHNGSITTPSEPCLEGRSSFLGRPVWDNGCDGDEDDPNGRPGLNTGDLSI